MPLLSTVFLKWKFEMLYVPLDCKNGLTKDAPLESGAYVSAQNCSKSIGQNQTSSPRQNFQNQRSSKISNTFSKWPVRKTISKSYTQNWFWRPKVCRTFCKNEEFVREIYRFAVHERQQCSCWHYPWLQSFTPLNNVSEKRRRWNKCQTPNWRRADKSIKDNENNHSFRWPSIKVENNRCFDRPGKIHWNSNYADFSLNVNNIWQ